MKDLANKNVIITGSSKGIGKNLAINFFNNNSNIFLISRNIKKLNKIKEELYLKKSHNQIIKCFEGDIVNKSQISKIFKEIYRSHNSIDVLINNAGITKDNIIVRMKDEEWDDVINTNLTGTFNCCKIVSKYMIKQRSGKIINISSIIAQIGNPGQSNYSASKAGVIGLTKSLAKELAPKNINVNAINPGYIISDMTDHLNENKKNDFLTKIPLKRFGEAQDISQLALFLSSKKSNYITGQSINIDGGLVMQ
tara:strand:+ start:159 stop:914 length:756 start_codon:yes stop_codon:yes gene_type:complete